MRKIIASLVGIALILCVVLQGEAATISGGDLVGNSWGQAFITDYVPTNVINLWSNGPDLNFQFEKAANMPAGWIYWISPDKHFMQLYIGSTPATLTTFTAWWLGNRPAPFYLDWQELTYDWSTPTVTAEYHGTLKWDGSSWTRANSEYGTYGGGTTAPVLPVPEPGSLLLLGSGLLGLVAAGREEVPQVNRSSPGLKGLPL